MRICIVGAGAIGGMLGVQLILAGQDVTFLCRGATLQAARRSGFRLIREDGTERHAYPVYATDKVAEAGVHDLVILALKAHQLPRVAAELPGLLGPDAMVVTMQNGIPWWYFLDCPGPYDGTRIEAVDPCGVIAANMPVSRVIGCVVYAAAEQISPGVIRCSEGVRFSIGEPSGAETPRVKAVSELLRKAGFRSHVVSDIRSEVWLKLWGNSTFNPISALTHATLAGICGFPRTRELAASMMAEVQALGEALGVHFRVSLEKRIAGAAAVGNHKTSTLQDVEQGRPLELEALVGSVLELGRITETPMPHLAAVYACASLLAKTLSDANGRLRIETNS